MSKQNQMKVPAGDRSEAELIELAREGDTPAFRALFERYQLAVYNFIIRSIGQAQDAEDITQEVFIKVYRKLPTLRDAGAFSAWLFATARHESINHLRKMGRRKTSSLDEVEQHKLKPASWHDEAKLSDPEQHAADTDMQALVQDALDTLPEINRSAFILGVLEGRSYREVAGILGCSEGNVKLRVFRARLILSEKLKPYFAP